MVSIIGLGESVKYFDGKGPTIGVNDCFKFHPVDTLLLIDPPRRFTPERRRIIETSKPKLAVFYDLGWAQTFTNHKFKPDYNIKQLFFSDGRTMRFSKYMGKLYNDRVLHSLTSPFVAISLAYVLGYKEIVLWGVDLNTHKSYHPGTEGLNIERDAFKTLIGQLNEVGVLVRFGKTGVSALE